MQTIPNKQAGFTLIELVVVIVILGILAATAIPKFVSLSAEASTAAVNGVAGALSSGNSINYGVRTANAAKGVAITNCTSVSGTLEGGLPAGYVITAAAVAAGVTNAACVLTGPNGQTANFTATGIL